MPYFKCKLINLRTGVKLTKEEYEEDKAILYDKLSKNFTILSIKQTKGLKKVKLRNADILFFFSYMYELAKIGVSMQEALNIMSLEIKTKNIKLFSQAVFEAIKSGQMLSQAIQTSAEGISDFYTSIISMGEISNNLPESFGYIVNYIKVNNLIKSKTRKAIAYPIFLLFIIFGVITGASTFMIPRMMEFGSSMGIQPSRSTLMLQSFAHFMGANWIGIISGLSSFFTAASVLSRLFPFVKKKLDWAKLQIPIVSSIIIKSNIAKFCIFFSIAYKSGTNIIEALEKSCNVINNDVMQKVIASIAEKVSYGSTVSQAMDNTIIPNFTVRMFKIGEATGEISSSLDNVVTFYTREIDNLSDNLIATIKPAGIMIAGGMIIWVISATILPIYTQFIGKMI